MKEARAMPVYQTKPCVGDERQYIDSNGLIDKNKDLGLLKRSSPLTFPHSRVEVNYPLYPQNLHLVSHCEKETAPQEPREPIVFS
jgi:hypothetical protein